MICGLDLGTHLTGYCVGAGATVPVAGAWRFDQYGDDIGELGAAHERGLDRLNAVYPLTHVVLEAPILRPHDRLLTLRKLYGMGAVVETWANRNKILYSEQTVRALKRELAGHAGASKDDMVFAALKMGVVLPEHDADGRKDAADAVAAWLIGIRCYARHHQARWDQALFGARGAML